MTLEALHPYVLTSHVRDSAVWRVPEGIAVAWVRMGEGDVDIDAYCRKYAELCPGRALSLESIVTGPRIFAYPRPEILGRLPRHSGLGLTSASWKSPNAASRAPLRRAPPTPTLPAAASAKISKRVSITLANF